MNTILLPVATMTWVYVGGVGRSSGLMSSSVIGLSVLFRCDGGYAGRLLPEAEHGAANPAQAGAPVGCWQHVHPAGRVAADRPFYSGNHVHDVPGIRPGSCSWRLRQDFRHLETRSRFRAGRDTSAGQAERGECALSCAGISTSRPPQLSATPVRVTPVRRHGTVLTAS